MEILFGLILLCLLYAIANVLGDLRDELERIRERMEGETETDRHTDRSHGAAAAVET
ncbi:MAG: hypothetical protein ACNS61_04300 [Candidatus Wenzhouxiangella sp. M2_3B_020]